MQISLLIKIIIIIFVIIVILHIYYFKVLIQNEKRISNTIKIKGLVNELKNGDIIFFSKTKLRNINDNIFRMFACVFSNTPYYHVGIVLVNNGNKYILNAVPEDYHSKFMMIFKKCNVTIRIAQLEDYLEHYAERYEPILKIYRKNEWKHNHENVINAAKTMCSYKFEIDISKIFFNNANNKKILNCTTFLGKLLEELLEIEKSNIPYKKYIPGRFQNILKKNGFVNIGNFILIK